MVIGINIKNDICMSNNLTKANIRIFVFGTLRQGGRLFYYMDGSKFKGMYYTEGQLMKSELGSAYINFKDKGVYTLGELYTVNFPCLKRINHLESLSGEFPTGYDLDIIPIWQYGTNNKPDFNPNKKELALFYRRRDEPEKILSGDWINRPKPIQEIERYLTNNNNRKLTEDDIIQHIIEYLDYKN